MPEAAYPASDGPEPCSGSVIEWTSASSAGRVRQTTVQNAAVTTDAIAAAHSGCLAAIMQAAGIDDWPPADSMPDITNPVITINLSTNQ